jgi:Calcineurin-like phosphoesterase
MYPSPAGRAAAASALSGLIWNWPPKKRVSRPDYPAAPEGRTLYAIGDVHGRADCLRRAFAAIDKDVINLPRGQSATEIYIGDYVDRGPDSKAVIAALIQRADLTATVFLRGNHEILLDRFLNGKLDFEAWRPLGGSQTALSYGVAASRLKNAANLSGADLSRLIPDSHLRFLSQLSHYFVVGDYCFVHAGLRPGVPIERQTPDDLAWIREDFLDYPGSFGPIVVHGHTPLPNIDFRRGRINIDTGAYITNRLSVIRIDAKGVTPLEVGAP